MSELPYLDIHRHRAPGIEDALSVISLAPDDLLGHKFVGTHTTAGIHPWWLEDFTSGEIEQLKSKIEDLAKKRQLWGIGESGLDRTMPDLMEIQKDLFLWHLKLAEEHQLPLMVHNVRSGTDFLQILKTITPKVPWIFHDFRGNEQLVNDLLRLHPECYFSFGISLDNSPQVRELLPQVPLSNIFLETDDQKHLDIHDIYVRARAILGVDMDFLKSQVWHNFKKVSSTIH